MTNATQATITTPRLNGEVIQRIAALRGPCFSVYLPAQQPGAPAGSRRTQFRVLRDELKKQETGRAWPDAEQWDPQADLDHGGEGYALFLDSDGPVALQVTGAEVRGVAGSYPYVVPLLEAAQGMRDLYVLDLNKKHVRLFEYRNGEAQARELPAGVPANFDAVAHHKHGIPAVTRTSGGPGLRFGTSGDRENARTELEHFCAQIDHGLRALQPQHPLLLMGVREELAAFRRVSHNDALLETEIDGNADLLTPAQIAARAAGAAKVEGLRIALAGLAEYQEMRDRTRALEQPQEVLRAAAEGRVHRLFLRAGTELLGPLPQDLDAAGLKQEDLLNAAAVETLRRGGEVFVVPAGQLAVTASVCAVLRY